MDKYQWSKEEEEYIASLIGYYPLQSIVKKVQQWSPHHIPPKKIRDKAQKVAVKLGEKIADRVDNYSGKLLAKLLGITAIRVYRWIDDGLKCKKSGIQCLIPHHSVVTYAKNRPKNFTMIERSKLEWLFLEEPHWVDIILKTEPYKIKARPVHCVDTNKTYPSLTTASLELGVSRDKIRQHIKSKLPAKIGTQYLVFKWAD